MKPAGALLVLSLIGVGLALVLPQARDLVLLAGPMALASLILLLRGRRRAPKDLRHVVIDGSNVLHWRGEVPDMGAVREVIGALAAQGFTPGVMFDANVGYKIGTRYQDDRAIARQVGLPVDRVLVVPKGVVADQYILQAARQLAAPIVSNDRYRDWAEAHPEVMEPGRVIRGGYRDGRLWLDGIG